MPPRKRPTRTQDSEDRATEPPKRLTKSDREKLIVKAKLDALEQEESLIRDDRFSAEEKKRLLDAYNDKGFHVFHNAELLHEYLPNRRTQDIKGLIQRLQGSLLSPVDIKIDQPECSTLDSWDKLCNQLTRNFAKDRKVNFDDVFADALLKVAEDFEQPVSSQNGPNYSELLSSFAQLMAGKFPENISPKNAQISRRIFEHINSLVDSIDLETISRNLAGGSWLESDIEERRRVQEMALDGLKELTDLPTFRELDKNRNFQALCLELPKIKRLTEILNPLRMNESLMKSANKLETLVDDEERNSTNQ